MSASWSERGKGKPLSHTATEWWILFGLCLQSPSLAALVCYVGFYGEKHSPCQTPSSTRKKKNKDGEGMAAGLWGKLDSKNSEGVESQRARHDRQYVCSKAKSPGGIKRHLRKRLGSSKGWYRIKLPITETRTDLKQQHCDRRFVGIYTSPCTRTLLF